MLLVEKREAQFIEFVEGLELLIFDFMRSHIEYRNTREV